MTHSSGMDLEVKFLIIWLELAASDQIVWSQPAIHIEFDTPAL